MPGQPTNNVFACTLGILGCVRAPPGSATGGYFKHYPVGLQGEDSRLSRARRRVRSLKAGVVEESCLLGHLV